MAQESNPKNTPVFQVRLKGVSASTFENKTAKEGVTYYKVTLQRTYKDGQSFKTTNTFSRDDLPLVAEAAQAAWRDILRRESDRSDVEPAESDATTGA